VAAVVASSAIAAACVVVLVVVLTVCTVLFCLSVRPSSCAMLSVLLTEASYSVTMTAPRRVSRRSVRRQRTHAIMLVAWRGIAYERASKRWHGRRGGTRWSEAYFLAFELYTAYFSARVSTAPGGLKRMPRSLTIDRAFWGSCRNK